MNEIPVAADPRAGYLSTLYRLIRSVNSALDVMQVLPIVVTSTAEALEARACSLRLLSPDGHRLFVAAAHGLSAAYRTKGPVDIAQSGIDRLALEAERPLYVGDAGADARVQYPEQMREEGIASLLVAPLRVQDRPVGVLRVYSARPRIFTAEETMLVEAMASLGALAVENGRLYDRLDHANDMAAGWRSRVAAPGTSSSG